MLHTRTLSYALFFNDTPTTEIYTLSLHDALPISGSRTPREFAANNNGIRYWRWWRQMQTTLQLTLGFGLWVSAEVDRVAYARAFDTPLIDWPGGGEMLADKWP